MKTLIPVAAALAVVVTPFAAALAAEKEVAGRPALSTESTEKLIAQRDKWGTEPSTKK